MAAVLGLSGRTVVPTELITNEPDQLAALLGVAPPDDLSAQVLPGLRLGTVPSGLAELTIFDEGALTAGARGPHRPGERRPGVLRGPCYLALRSLLGAGRHGLSVLVLVLVPEPGRALTERDVTDISGFDVVATVPANPAVARTIDAGLLASRVTARPGFRSVRRWLTDQLKPSPPRSAVTHRLHRSTPQRSAHPADCRTPGVRSPRALSDGGSHEVDEA